MSGSLQDSGAGRAADREATKSKMCKHVSACLPAEDPAGQDKPKQAGRRNTFAARAAVPLTSPPESAQGPALAYVFDLAA